MAAGKVVVYSGGKLTKTSSGEDATIDGNLIITENLTVNGTTTTINSTTLSVDDKNIELGSVDTPTDSTADGGGITLKGATDHTILWTNSTDSWDFSEHVNIASGKQFQINGTQIASTDLSDGSGLQHQPSEGAFVDGDKTKLDGIEASADVTDATNVAAAGALMDGDFSSAGFMVADDGSGTYSTQASIGYSDLTSADIDTDLSSVSANHDSLASAKAIKDYVDGEVSGSTLTGGSNISINSNAIDLDSNIDLGDGGDLTADVLQANLIVMSPSVAITSQPNTGLTLNIGRAVCIIADGKIDHADNTSASKDLVVGIIMDDGAENRATNGYGDSDDVPVAIAGSIVVAAFTGSAPSAGAEVYLATGGQLTATAPTSGAIIRVGYMYNNAENKILVQPQFIMDN